jgi:5-methyltetrahydrofolate--homocysteine methyltransferase
VSTSKQMPIAVSELHEKGHEFPVLIGGAAINRNFGRRILYPKGKESDEIYEPGVFYCKDAFEGLSTVDQLVDAEARAALLDKIRAEAKSFREKPQDEDEGPPTTDDSVRSPARTDVPIPEPPFWGVREIPVDLDEVFPHLDVHVLYKLHWGGKGVKGEAWQKLVAGDGDDEGFRPKLERMWAEQKTDKAFIKPRALLGYFPANSDGNEIVVFDPEDHDKEIARLVAPRQPKNDRICLADFFRPLDSGERDVVALQAVTVGDEATALGEKLEAEGEYSERLFVHGLAVQAAEGTAEWLHQKVRADLGLAAGQGRRYSWGYPAIPEQSEHDKVQDLLDMESIGITLSGGHALTPEQSTAAVIAHHPQASYFGTRQGRIPDGDATPDEVIALTDKSAAADAGGDLPDSDPDEEGDMTPEGAVA